MERVTSVAAALADAGCEVIVLDDRRDCLGSLGEDCHERFPFVLEKVQSAGGGPEGARVGLRLAATPMGTLLSVRAAQSFGIEHLECCPFGEAAPSLGAVARKATEAGIALSGADLDSILA
eukprot:4952150-Prymnesium_polylepis.1